MSAARRDLEAALDGVADQNERTFQASRVILAVLDRHGIALSVVGGSAIAIWAPQLHTSRDIDLVGVADHQTVDRIMRHDLGLARSGHHWHDDELRLAVEFTAIILEPEGAVPVEVDGVRVISLEDLILDRVQAWEAIGALDHLDQARALLHHPQVDRDRLERRAGEVGSHPALAAVRLVGDREVDSALSHGVQRALADGGVERVRGMLARDRGDDERT